jgi:hypothetical protein
LQVTSDTRNTKIVAMLIGSMTIGAAALLWLEPPTPGWSSATLLMAESVRPIEDVQIDYVEPGSAEGPAAYDCVIAPSGQCTWRPQGPQVRMAVIGAESGRMTREQAEKVLAVFGSLSQRHGLDLERVWLHPASDARLHPELPAPAHDLCDLLVRKGIIP